MNVHSVWNYTLSGGCVKGVEGAALDEKEQARTCSFFEATTGFEPVIRVLQTLALPLGHVAVKNGCRQMACSQSSHLPPAI
jgi:hypothetical protein